MLLLLLAWAGLAAFQAYGNLASRVSALEAQLQAQGETLKALSERLGKVEEEVFQAPGPPIGLPEPPQVPGAPVWPYAVGVVLVLILLLLLFRFLRGSGKGASKEEGGSSPSPSPEEARMVDEGAPPKPGEEGKA
ncbi:hypothetical protein [Thermus sediminis]|uniref:hypothetical protein n=1 Tax=Thermus sediminis TaxID=1761908 RepID=UPI001E49A963|nr:hypothetical protein [Thermus sediminis]